MLCLRHTALVCPGERRSPLWSGEEAVGRGEPAEQFLQETPHLWYRWELSFIESQTGLGWKGPCRPSSSNPRAVGRDASHQTQLLQAPSNLALNTAREGAATASLGNLCQGLTTLRVKNFFLTSNLNLRSFSLKPSSLVLLI